MRFRILLPVLWVVALSQTGSQDFQSASADSDFDRLCNAFFREYLERDPETAAQLGDLSSLGYASRKDMLTDKSENAVSEFYAFLARFSGQLEAIDPRKLTPAKRASRDVLRMQMKYLLEGERFRYHDYIPNHMFGMHNFLTDLMTEYHAIENVPDAANYISRLRQYPRRVAQELDAMNIRATKGIVAPRFILDIAETEMTRFVGDSVQSNVLFTSFRAKVEKLQDVAQEVKAKLCHDAERGIEEGVLPAYRKFIDRLRELKAIAGDKAGAWSLPNGDEYYRYCLRFQTTTSLTPQQVHEIGLREVKRIQEEAKAVLQSLGYSGEKPYAQLQRECFTKLYQERNERHFYPTTPAAREQIVRDYQAIVDKIQKDLPLHFSLRPKASVIVQATPRHKENVMPPSYSPGSLDGKRPGIYYVTPVPGLFKGGMTTLSVHEALPGHHFQIALERESQAFHPVKSLFECMGFIEGWALYAERLALENGWFDDPYTKLGYYNSELLRAVRLVLDTGIHFKRWTREQANQYAVENLGYPLVREVNRYVVLPGQACTYKIGELKIRELREEARKSLGSRFDIKEFHRIVLQDGDLPLELLERRVGDYLDLERQRR